MDANTGLAVLTFLLVLVTGYYAWEARQARIVSQRNLDELVRSRQVAEEAVAEAARSRQVSERALAEAERSRLVSEQSLAELKAQNERSYEAYVRSLGFEASNRLVVANLGPGPAVDVEVRMVHMEPTHEVHLYKGSVDGLPPQGTVTISLQETTESYVGWPNGRPGNFTIEVSAKTVKGQAMTPHVSYQPVQGAQAWVQFYKERARSSQ